MTATQVALASLDAFVILTGSGVISNLLAGWISHWWTRRGEHVIEACANVNLGIVSAPMPGGRCEHLRVRELCDDCNTKGA